MVIKREDARIYFDWMDAMEKERAQTITLGPLEILKLYEHSQSISDANNRGTAMGIMEDMERGEAWKDVEL
jgi:hypothetical protein